MIQQLKRIFLILLTCSGLYGCAPSIALYDHFAYTQITSLKVETLYMMDKATAPYNDHITEATQLMMQLEKAKEYCMHRPKNKISGKQWQLLLDPDEGSVGGFMQLWKTETEKGKTLSPAYIRNKKEQIGKQFDTIAELESKKQKETNKP